MLRPIKIGLIVAALLLIVYSVVYYSGEKVDTGTMFFLTALMALLSLASLLRIEKEIKVKKPGGKK